MSEPIMQLSSGQTLSSSIIDSSDSSQEKKEVINKLQNKVTNLLIIRKNNEKLVKSQDNFKKCLERLDQYKKLNQELQQKNNIFCDAFGIPYNSDLGTIKKLVQEMKSKSLLLNTIQNELNIPQNFSLDQSDIILNSIQKLKDKDSENNRFILKILRMLGIFTNYSSFDSSQNNENPTSLLFEEIQRIKDEVEKLKASVENFTYQQNEICQMLDIDNSKENDSYTLHFRIKGAIKNIKNNLRDEETGNDMIISQKKIDTPQIVQSTISDLQNYMNKIKKDLFESEQKLKQTTNQLQNIEKKNDSIIKKFKCSSIDEVSQNIEELMIMMKASNPEMLRNLIRQMKNNNQSLLAQTHELNSTIQSLQLNNQTLNDQLLASQDQLNYMKSNLNESEAKKTAYKDELKELKSKINSIKMEIKAISIERNSLKGQLADKDEEISSLKEILQTEKGNVKIHFDEMECQILTLKQQNRKNMQEADSIRSDYANLQQNYNLLQKQYKTAKDEKQNLESELENSKSQIRNLNKEIGAKSNELETLKGMNKSLKQQNQSIQNEIDELTAEKSNLKHKINDLNDEKSQILSQLEIEQIDNQLLKSTNEENQSKITQLESQNSQQKSEIDKLNQINKNLLNKTNEYKKQTSQLLLKVSEYEQNNQEMKNKIDQFQSKLSSTKLENESLQSQINSLKNEIEKQRNENIELKKTVFQLQNEKQSDSYKSEDLESKISQLMNENSKLKRLNEENNQIINQMVHDQSAYCKLLGINTNSTASSITDSISDLLYDNKGMYSENQNMKQQLASISTLLNIGESSHPDSIQNTINSLYDEIQQYETKIDKMNLELNNMKQSNQKMCQILNVMTDESLIDAISSVQATVNHIKQILNVSDDRIIDCIESLHESIQTLCDALNIDPSDSWIDSVLAMYEALQDAAELLGITNSNQLADAIQKVLTEKDQFSVEMKQISEVISKWRNNSSENTPTIIQSHESILSSLCDEMQTMKPEQLLSEVTDLINQNNQFCDHIEILKSNEEKIFALFGIEPSQIKLNSVNKIKEAVDHYNEEIRRLKKIVKSFQSDYDRNNSLKDQADEFQQDNLNQKFSLEKDDLNNKIELLQSKVESLSQMNEELKLQNSGLENYSLLEKQFSDICRQLQIDPSTNQKISELIAESIESLQKTKEEFISFKLKVNKLLKLKKNDENSNEDNENSEKSTAETLGEIEALNQLVSNLCELFNVNSQDLLLDEAKKQDALLKKIYPLFEIFNSNFNVDSTTEDEQQNWQNIIQDAKKAKEINDQISGLLNVKDSSEIINEIKNIQNQLETMKTKDDENAKFIDKLCETLELTKDENNNDEEIKTQKIEKAICELKENSEASQKVITQLASLFECEADKVSDFAELICQSMKNIATTLNVNEQSPDLFSSVENQIKEIKEQNDSLNNKFNEERSFLIQFLNDMNISNDQPDVREVLTNLRDSLKKEQEEKNSLAEELSNVNESLKKEQEEKNSLVEELSNVNESLKKEQEEKNSLIEELSNVNESLKKEQEEKNSLTEELANVNDSLKKEQEEKNSLTEELKNVNDSLKKEQEEKNSLTEELKNVNDSLKKEQEIKNSLIEELNTVNDSLRKEKEEKNSLAEELKNVSDSLKKEQETKNSLVEELTKVNNSLKNEQEEKNSLAEELSKVNESLRKEKEEKNSIVNELNDKISFYKSNNRKLFQKLEISSKFEDENDIENSEDSKMKEVFNKIDEFQQIKIEYQKSVKKNKELDNKMKSIESEIIRHANQIKQSRREVSNIDDALKHMKNHENQLTKLREIVDIPDSQFSAVVEKVSRINDQLNSEISQKEKLNQEIKATNKKIRDFEKNVAEHKKIINSQKNKIDLLIADVEKKDRIINNLNSSLKEIFKSIGDENIQSADFAIDMIEDLKRKIAELTKELCELKPAVTIDNAFDKMSTNEKQQLKIIKKKIIEQTDIFNSAITILQSQMGNKNQNKEEIVRILKDAEANNFRLLELLDPPLSSVNNNNVRIHIGNEYSMNPFVKQNVDMFRKRKSNLDSVTKEEQNRQMLNRKIICTENNLINQKKKIDIAERKLSALNTEQRQRISNANHATPISELIAQRLKREQTTLF